MSEYKSVADTPTWFEVSDADRDYIAQQDFEQNVATTDTFKNASPEDQQYIRDNHRPMLEQDAFLSQHNPDVAQARQNQTNALYDGYWGNLWTMGKESFKDAGRTAQLTDDLVGKSDGKTAEQLATAISKARHQINLPSQKKLENDWALMKKTMEADGVLNDAGAIINFAVEAITNPKGLVALGVESSASLGASLAGGLTGAKVGTVATAAIPVPGARVAGATVGGAVGTAAAIGAHSANQKLREKVQEQLAYLGLAPTKHNIQKLLEQPELFAEAQNTAVRYGVAMGASEAILGGIGGKLATTGTRIANKTAAKMVTSEMVEATAKGLGVTTAEARKIATNQLAKSQLAQRGITARFKGKLGAYGYEIASEPATEAIATVAAGEELDAKELVFEALGGIGAGPVGVATNIAVFGTPLAGKEAAKAAARAAKKVQAEIALTPEQKAERRTVRETLGAEVKAARKVAKADAALGYNKDVKESTPDDSRIDAMSDPANDAYDPIKAMNILVKSKKVEHLEKADALLKKTNDVLVKNLIRQEELKSKHETDGTLTPAETEELNHLATLTDIQWKTYKRLEGIREQQKTNVKAPGQATQDVNITEETTALEVVNMIGQDSQGSGPSSLDDTQLEAFKSRSPDMTPEQATVVDNKIREIKARKILKSMEDVNRDVYEGLPEEGFTGITFYQQRIQEQLAAGDTKGAAATLEKLSTFRDKHARKKAVVDAKWAEVNDGEVMPDDMAAEYAEMQVRNNNFWINQKTPQALIDAIGAEVEALDASVALQESLMGISQAPESAPEAAPAAPTEKTSVIQKDEIEAFERWLDENTGHDEEGIAEVVSDFLNPDSDEHEGALKFHTEFRKSETYQGVLRKRNQQELFSNSVEVTPAQPTPIPPQEPASGTQETANATPAEEAAPTPAAEPKPKWHASPTLTKLAEAAKVKLRNGKWIAVRMVKGLKDKGIHSIAQGWKKAKGYPEGVIFWDPDFAHEAFEKKVWTGHSKYNDGSRPAALPEDMFKTFDEFIQFVQAHEEAHLLEPGQQKDESTGQYEDRMTRIALENIGREVPEGFGLADVAKEGTVENYEQQLQEMESILNCMGIK